MPKVSLHMTEADFLAGQRAFYRMKLWVKLMLAAAGALTVLTMVAGVDIVLRRGAGGVFDLAPLAMVALLWAWYAGRLLLGSPGNARRYFRQSKLSRPLEYEWDEAGLSVRGEDMFQRLKWSDMLRWAETRATIALMITDRSYIPIPKRFFTAEDLEDLRSRLRAAKVRS
jgi:hypothetical protein